MKQTLRIIGFAVALGCAGLLNGPVLAQGRGGANGFPFGPRGNATTPTTGRNTAPQVVAVAEERSNSLIISAPEEQLAIIEDLIRQVDKSVDEVTELRVFRLRYADAQETADLLNNLFTDASSTQGGGILGQLRFGGRFGGPFAGPRAGAANTAESARLQKQSRVVAVPDLRTGAVVVSAARDLMVQIGQMIEELDSDPAKKQQVFVFDVQNTDPQEVQNILQSLFPSPNYGNYGGNQRLNTRQQTGAGNQLNNRANQSRNQGYGTRTGNTGFGGVGASGFGGGMTGFGGVTR